MKTAYVYGLAKLYESFTNLFKKFSITILHTKIIFHWSLFLSLFYIAYIHSKGFLYGLLFAIGLHISVLIHEFGHIFAAKSFKVQTRNVVMTFLGGAADIDITRNTRNKTEFWIAIAGPATSLALSGLCLMTISLYELFGIHYGIAFLKDLCIINIAIVIFNMLPAFPFDGGRILRSILGKKYGRDKATNICIHISIGFGICFVIGGFFLKAPTMVIIGIILLAMGWAHKKKLLGEV